MGDLEKNIRNIILENQTLAGTKNYFPREMKVERIPGKATVITGIRRCGKSVYESIYMQQLLREGVSRRNLCVIDFSDDRLMDLRSGSPGIVADVYYGMFPEKTAEKVWFFFDEIQNLNHWELFVNRLQNTRNCEVNITGSSAKLLAREIATEFGARSLPWELFPLSFREYLTAAKDAERFKNPSLMSDDDAKLCQKYLKEYEVKGGFPETLLMKEDDTRIRYLQNLTETVIFRDVIRRYNLPNPEGCYRLMQILLSQMSSLMTFNKQKKRLDSEQHHLSVEMISDITGYLNDAYLIFTAEILSPSSAVRKSNPKKVYCVDHSAAMATSGSLSEDRGKILENMVYMHLRRKTDRIWYAKTSSGKEIDFAVLKRGQHISQDCLPDLYQVCWEMNDEKTYQRELNALKEGMEEFHVSEGKIITENTEDTIRFGGRVIDVIPAWKFFLDV